MANKELLCILAEWQMSLTKTTMRKQIFNTRTRSNILREQHSYSQVDRLLGIFLSYIDSQQGSYGCGNIYEVENKSNHQKEKKSQMKFLILMPRINVILIPVESLNKIYSLNDFYDKILAC